MNRPLTAICAATFQRPKMLTQLLESLRDLDLEGLNVHLIIADNDPAESARETFERLQTDLPFPATYVSEPSRGLASVRNRLVMEARVIGADFIASIDDDEVADTYWLKTLIEMQAISRADAVAGNNIRWMDDDIPMSRKNCFQIRKEKDGESIQYFGTGNVLLSMSALNRIDGPFDTRMNLTGGEDSMLSARFTDMGFQIVYSSKAKTHEYIPRSRTSPKYILQRAFRAGTTRSKIVRWSDPTFKDYFLHVGYSLGVVAKHGTLAIPNAFTRPEMLLFRLRGVVSGIGGIAGIITTRAYSHKEYATVHGE